MSIPPPESVNPSENNFSWEKAAELTPYDIAIIEFDRANAALLDAACEMVVNYGETGETGEDMTQAATDTMVGMRSLLIETWRNDGHDDDSTAAMIEEFIKAHDAERVDLFNQMMGPGYFSYAAPITLEDLVRKARELHGVGEAFIETICDNYAEWVSFDLDMLVEAVERRRAKNETDAQYDDSFRQELISEHYMSLLARRERWPEYDESNPDHLRVMAKKLLLDARRYIPTTRLKIGGRVDISGCSVVTCVSDSGQGYIKIPEECRTTGTIVGLRIGPAFAYHEEERRAVMTHAMGLHIAISDLTFYDGSGQTGKLTGEGSVEEVVLPIVGDNVHMIAEKLVLN